MDERGLILKVSTQFASLWTEFEIRVGELHRHDSAQQLQTKVLLTDNILWQLLQSSASSRARMCGAEDSVVQLEHVYGSLERTAQRMASRRVPSPSTMHKVRPAGQRTPHTPGHTLHTNTTVCDCGGALYLTDHGPACTACGAQHTHNSHQPRIQSVQRVKRTPVLSPSRGYRPSRPTGIPLPRTDQPVFDMDVRTRQEDVTCKSCRRSVRRERSQASSAESVRGRVPAATASTPARKQGGTGLDRSPLKRVEENCSKFDFKKSQREPEDEEAAVGRYPSTSPRDRRPVGEGWSKLEGRWQQWESHAHARRDYRMDGMEVGGEGNGEAPPRSESPQGEAELVSVSVTHSAPPPQADARPSDISMAAPPPPPPPPPPAPPAPAPVPATRMESARTASVVQVASVAAPAAPTPQPTSPLTAANLQRLNSATVVSSSRQRRDSRNRLPSFPSSAAPQAAAGTIKVEAKALDGRVCQR